MSDLDPAHVEAVASLVGEWLFRMHGIQSSCDHRIEAEELLTSTDPAVHAALLAALVRAGVLSEEPTIEVHEDDRPTYYVGFGSQATYHPRRRYVTRWEDVE